MITLFTYLNETEADVIVYRFKHSKVIYNRKKEELLKNDLSKRLNVVKIDRGVLVIY